MGHSTKTQKDRANQERVRPRRRIGFLMAAALILPVLTFGVPVMAADPLAAMEIILTERGKEASDFTLPDPDGERMGLRDFRGKVVLLTFFTTW